MRRLLRRRCLRRRCAAGAIARRADRLAARLRRRRAACYLPAGGAERSASTSSATCWSARRCSSSRRHGCSSPPALDVRANTHDQVDDELAPRLLAIAGAQRPALSVRRLSATLSRGRFTLDAGKQFIRWGKTDIVTPTDRFAPRDFLNVIDTEFLPVTGVARRRAARRGHDRGRVGAALHAEPDAAARPALDRRRRPAPPRAARRTPARRSRSDRRPASAGATSGAGRVLARRSSTASTTCPTSSSIPHAAVPAGRRSARDYPALRSYGGDAAVPTPLVHDQRRRRRTSRRRRRGPTSTCCTSCSSSARPASGCSSAATPGSS